MRKKNELKRRLKNDDIAIGTWCVIPSSSVINILGASGLDFVIIDMEHGPFCIETAEDCVRAAESEKCSPIIRVPKNDEAYILRALDIGAHGVIVPHIETVEDAKDAISHMKYHPIGHRGFTPYTRAGGYSKENIDKHAERENEETMTILIIEGIKGMQNLDKIIEEKYIDVIYIGQYDLSQAIGMPGKVNDPKVINFMETNVEKIREKGIAVGSLAHNLKEINFLMDLGFQFITYIVDGTVLYHAFNDIVKEFKIISKNNR